MCTICDLRIEFSIDHPLGLSVAVETRRAIDAGLLPEPDGQDDAPAGLQLRRSAIEALKAAQQRLEWTQRQDELLALPDFFVLLVESRTWGFFRPTPNGFDPNCRPDPPNVAAADIAERDAVLVGSELAMRQIVGGICRSSGPWKNGSSRSMRTGRVSTSCWVPGAGRIPRSDSAASSAPEGMGR